MRLSPADPATRRTVSRRSARRPAAGRPVRHRVDSTPQRLRTTTATTPYPQPTDGETPARPVLRQQWIVTTAPDGRPTLTARWLVVPGADR
jgi:hypothetical protein